MEEVHLAILLGTAVAILWADHLGFQYFRGVRQTLDVRIVQRLHYTVLVGLVGMVVTGVSMAYDRFGYLSTLPQFWLKMGFVVVLIVNSFAIGTLQKRATEVPFATLPFRDRALLLVSGAASGAGWLGAAVIGLFFL